ncbi:MAG: PhoH family protein [Phycisphaeraceae bacterium]
MELTITIPQGTDRVAMLGTAERNLKLLREALGVSISARDEIVRLSGDGTAVNRAAQMLAQMTEAARRKRPLTRDDLIERINRLSQDEQERNMLAPPRPRQPEANGQRRSAAAGAGRDFGHAAGEGDETDAPRGRGLDVYVRGKPVVGRTQGQKHYLEAISKHDLTVCTGPAGTGKTYLAVAAAVAMLKRGDVRKLVLARPAVEAGEKLGFLPGDMQQKVNPYLRPLLDALHDMMPFEQVQRFMQSDLIEIVPLAFMRGRTLNEAAIILDEAQNTTRGQMLMFLTRMGEGSKTIVTGDTSQVDLEEGTESGLIDAARRLRTVPGVAFVTLARQDIVRHALVQRIVDAYGKEPETAPPPPQRGPA